jgi:hypothetical protein
MTTPISDPVIAPIAADLLLCLADELAKVPNQVGLETRPVCLRPGDRVDLLISQTSDECCEGLSWVRMARQYPSGQQRFPLQDDRVTPCDVLRWAVVFELGSVRCAPTAEAEDLPSCEEWTETTLNQYDDLAALRRVACCYQRQHTDRLIAQDVGEPITTEGGCTGVTLLLTISAPACDCVEE